MRYSLLIYLQAHTSQVSWATFDTTGRVIDSASNVSIQTVPKGPARVLIPSTETLLTLVDIPTKQWQRVIQAIPYALEEQLIAEIEELHFALGKRDSHSGLIPVGVIAKLQMDNYLQQLTTAGITPTVLIPEVLAIPKPNEGWGIVFWNQLVLVRTGTLTGFAIETEYLELALSLAWREQTPPTQFTVFRGETAVDLTPLTPFNLPIIEQVEKQGTLAWFTGGATDHNTLNFLQGDYRPVDQITLLWRPWRLTAALLLLWIGIMLGKQWLEYQQLNQISQQLNQAIEKVYRDTFPQARKIVNPRVQMEQQLKALRQSPAAGLTQTENFLVLFNQLSPPFQQTQGVELKQVDYRQAVFNLEVEVTQWPVLEQLKQRLSNMGLNAKIQTATHRNDRIESRLRIEKVVKK